MPSLYAEKDETKISEVESAKLWHERIRIAKQEHDQWATDSGAKRFIDEYRGKYDLVFHGRNKKFPVPPINEVFSYVQSDIASVFNRDPYLTVIAKAGTPKGAALWEVILNYWWRELKTKEELEYEIIDKDLVGFGWHKVGYSPDTDRPFSKFVAWNDVLWNIGSKRPPVDCQWMAQRIVWPLRDVKEKYPAAKGMEGSPDPCLDEDTYKKSSYKDDIKVAVLWEIHDAKTRQIYLIADNLKDKYLEKPRPWPDYQDEFPFLMYWDFAVPGRPRPMSAIAPWEAQILEKMILMAQAINHSKRWNRQAWVKNAQIDENALDKFERGDDGAIIVTNSDVGPDSLRFVDFGSLPPDFYLLMDRLDSEKRNLSGIAEFMQGGVTKTSTRTIGELQLMQQGNQSRQSRKIDRLETHCENIGRHMMACLKANFDFEQILKITGDTPEEVIEALGQNYNPETQQVTFSVEEIQGEYDVDVKSGSTLPMDKQTRMQVHEIILNAVAPVAAQGPLSNFMVTLVGNILQDYDDKSLKEAYAKDLQAAEQAKQEQSEAQKVEEQKTIAEGEKRAAQAEQVATETAMQLQDLELGPVGRAQMERLKKDPLTPKPTANGKAK